MNYFRFAFGFFFWSISVALSARASMAATWSEVRVEVSQNAGTMNDCLILAQKEVYAKSPSTVSEGVEMRKTALKRANKCLNPILKNPLDNAEVDFIAANSLFSNRIDLSTRFSVNMDEIIENDFILASSLNDFTTHHDECYVKDLNQFSYKIKSDDLEVLKVIYSKAIIDELSNQDNTDEEIDLLRESLKELIQTPLELIRMQSSQSSIQSSISSIGYSILMSDSNFHSPSLPMKSYSSIDRTPQVSWSCESEESYSSISTDEEGIATGTNTRYLTEGRGYYQHSNNREKISFNGYDLTIKTRLKNNRADQFYQGIPLFVQISDSISLPKRPGSSNEHGDSDSLDTVAEGWEHYQAEQWEHFMQRVNEKKRVQAETVFLCQKSCHVEEALR